MGQDFATLEPSGAGNTYYVSGQGNDAHTGLSISQAFRTLQRAADLTQPGDTVLVMNGVYTSPGTGSLVLYIENSGTPENWIRYKSYPGHTPRIKVNQHWAGIVVGGADYILVEGFTVEGNAPNVSLEYALQEMSNLANPITSGSCIAVRRHFTTQDYAHHVVIRNNHAFNCPGGGIESKEVDYLRIEDNLVHHNAFYSPYANSGISVYLNWNSDNSTATKMIIRRNISYKNENKVPHYYTNPSDPGQRVITDGNGIIVDDTRNIQNEVPSESYKGRTLVENNLVYDNGGRGILVYLSDQVTVRHNTSYRNARTASLPAEMLINESARMVIYGNIIVPRPDRFSVETYDLVNVRFHNNIYYGGTGHPGLGPGERIINPKFVFASTNPAAADFHLQASSPAIDQLTSSTPGTDLEKTLRPQGIASDIGAYEFSISAP
jgi:parallel beta-helix repeat protein